MKKAVLLSMVLVSVIVHQAQSQCSQLVERQGEPGRGHVGELMYFDISPQSDWNSPIHWTLLSLPPGIDTLSYGGSVFRFYGSPTQPGTFTYSVKGETTTGCQGTFSITQTYICFPDGLWDMDPISGALTAGEMGQPYSQSLYIGDEGYEISRFHTAITAGSLPPGLAFTDNDYFSTIAGTPTATGTYSFSVTVTLGTCTIIRRDYTLGIAPPGCGAMRVFSDYIGQEYNVGDTIKIQHYVTDDEFPPYTYEALELPGGTTLSASGQLVFLPDHAGSYYYTIRVTNSVGCSITFNNQVTVICFPTARGEATFNGLKKGQYFEASVPIAERMHPPFSDFQTTPSELPAGITLSSNGILSGTPTVFGSFQYVDIIYKGLGGCPGRTSVTFNINNNQPVKTLYLYSVCAQNESVRNWKVNNQNSFPVNVTWETLYYNVSSSSFTAAPGDNFFSTPAAGGPNTVRIKWMDENGNSKTLVQPANNNLCNPPVCVVGTSVDFYHQGQQRDGSHVQADVSNPSSVLGMPDANDSPTGASHAFSLGFDGFIIIQLNADLVDKPGKDLTVYEYSPNNPSFSSNPERAEVFASTNGVNWVSLGVTSPSSDCHQKMDTEFDLAGKLPWCRFIKVLDVSNRNAKVLNANNCAIMSAFAFNATSNGFDLDAITCVGGDEGNAVARTYQPAEFTPSGDSPLYPNPAIDKITVDFSLDRDFVYPDNGEVEITIIDMSGTSVYNGNHMLDDQWTTACDVSNLNSGLFLAKVKAGASSRVYKFVKK